MMDKVIKFLTLGMTDDQLKFLRDQAWRALVAFHMAYACGYLTLIGLPISGFAHESEMKDLRVELDGLKTSGVLQARLGIVREIRLQTTAMCSTADPSIRVAMLGTIDRLRDDYRVLTGVEYPEVRCP